MSFPPGFVNSPRGLMLGGVGTVQTLTVTSNTSFQGAIAVTSIATVGAIVLSTVNGIRFASSAVGSSGIAAGTLTNAPIAGNPITWIPVVYGGSTLYFPAWSS